MRFVINMTKIVTADNCFSATGIPEEHLDEIRDDLEEVNELIAFQHFPEEGTVTGVIDISKIDTDLRYIH